MSLRHAERIAAERLRLLEMEALLQRTELAATFAKWESRKAMAWGATAAAWGLKLVAQPRIRWLLVTTLLARLKGRRGR
jgi:hypothetical protein